MFCKKCGKEMDEGMTFCPFCGQEQTESTAENTEKKQENISNKQLIIAGVIMAAVILAVIGVFKLLGRESKEDVMADIPVETQDDSEVQQAENPEAETIRSAEPETEKEIEETAETQEVAEPETAETPQIPHIVVGENEYWFDEDGDLIRVTGECSLNIKYLTDAEGNKITGENLSERFLNMWFYQDTIVVPPGCNSKGHLIESIVENDETITYTYDGEKLTSVQMTNDPYGNIDKSFQYETDRIIVSTYNNYDGYDGLEDDWEVVTCSSAGDKIVECVRDTNSFLDSYRVWEYNENGKLIREKYDQEYINCDTTHEILYQYDGEGNLIRCEEHKCEESKEGVEIDNTVTISQYQYDKDGNMIKQDKETQSKKYEDYVTTDSQYDENGNQVWWKFNEKSLQYDETGAVVEQKNLDRNRIWEYDTEGKLIYASSLGSSTGNNVNESVSEYLYDEQGRLAKILTDGEVVMVTSYTDEGTLQQIDLVKESYIVERSAIYNLLSEEERAEIYFFEDYTVLSF